MNGKSLFVILMIVGLGFVLGIILIPQGPTSKAPRKTASMNLSKVANLGIYNLDGDHLDKLRNNGFLVLPSKHPKIFGLYEEARRHNQPLLVTTDLVLHTAHLLFDYTLRLVEIEGLKPELMDLTEDLLEISQNQYRQAQDTQVKEAAKKNIAFFGVALKLLGVKDTPLADSQELVDKELQLIENHAGIATSPLLGYQVDYGQYKPRGHYTRSVEFTRYFKAMIWYGKMMLRLKPGQDPEKLAKGREETLSALLITHAFQANPNLLQKWRRIYETTSFFTGEADNLQANDYLPIMKEVYGQVSSIQEFTDGEKLDRFIDRTLESRTPKILPVWAAQNQVPIKLSQGFCFMGQRFIPDSYIFQQLVYDQVGTVSNPRLFPKGLDVMAVLGSKEAEEILKKEGDFEYSNYASQLINLKEKFIPKNEKEWTKNLYWQWFYSLKSLLEERVSGPFFTQNEAWSRKELNTALGSWTELRHDTILYAKPSVTMGRGIVQMTKGYVEPYPHLYERMGDLVLYIREELASRNLLPETLKKKLTEFGTVVSKLNEISEKELKGQELAQDEYELIWDIGSRLEKIANLPESIREKIISGEDEQMALVVDVHTDPQTGQVLEEAVGNPFAILVLVEIEGEIKLVKGGVFSYYEFTQPIDQRLTDGEWQEMLLSGKAPEVPDWTKSFIEK